jgi:hypothetical protein
MWSKWISGFSIGQMLRTVARLQERRHAILGESDDKVADRKNEA